jgi:16S rRNA (uracil1498-N3)-methyltransferase
MVPSSGHLFYVDDLDHPELDDPDHHHASRVLRLGDGEVITVADGRGTWRRARWVAGRIAVDGEPVDEPAPVVELCVAFALVKGDKPELVVQKLTELGIDRIVPFSAARSVVRWDADRAARAHQRMAATAREAGMQSRRARLPRVDPPATFDQVAALAGAVRADRGGRPVTADDRIVLVGPEGGWAAEEVAAVGDAVSLADGVLRADTAAIAAGVALSGFRSGRFQRGG